MFSNVLGIYCLPMDVNLTTVSPLMLAHGCPLHCCPTVELKPVFLLLSFQNEHFFEYLWTSDFNLGTRAAIVQRVLGAPRGEGWRTYQNC